MSAVAGLWWLDGRPVRQVTLESMLDQLSHRGSDGKGAWHDGAIGLGQRLLWTTPESLAEDLPLVGCNLALIADARIDNRSELIQALGLRDQRQTTDGELIWAAYQRWGQRCPEKLIGDYVFAIWDQSRQELFCARDHFGVKPFYYYYNPGQIFVFASEIKALFCIPEVPRRLNEVRVADHLSRVLDDKTITFYRNIMRLPPAHSVVVGARGMRLQQYAALDPVDELHLRSNEEYAEAFRDVFTEAVRCRLRSAYPVGSFLSGGLDSSSIACTARTIMTGEDRGALHTFSAIFPDLPEKDLKKIDERHYVSQVTARPGIDAHFIRADQLSPFAELDRVLWHEDEAVLAPNLYIHWAIYKTAHQHGVRALLDGIDGDTTVSHGLQYLEDLARQGHWGTLAAEAMALSTRAHRGITPLRIMWQLGFRPMLPESLVRIWRWLARRNDLRPSLPAAINPDFAQRVGVQERMRAMENNGSKRGRRSRYQHWEGLNSGLIPYSLELMDKASAAFSLESRFPFFDWRLAKFCLALPVEQKLNDGWNRIVMRRAMAGILPEPVQWRYTKADLGPNFKRRLLSCERELLDNIILKDSPVLQEYFDINALRSAYHRYASQPVRNEEDSLTVYGAAILALWLRRSNLSP